MTPPFRLTVFALALAVAFSAVVAGCSSSDEATGATTETETTFLAPGKVNVLAGSYRGVALGDPISRMNAVFGPKTAVHNELVAPSNETVDDHYGAPAGGVRGPGPSSQDSIYRYEDVVFLAFDATIELIGVGEEGAVTERSVKIGDSLEQARASYPNLTCGVANEGTDYPTYPGCTGKVGTHYVWFGGDPIRYIEFGMAKFSL